MGVVALGLLWKSSAGRHWIRASLVSLAETWLVPEVVLDDFAIEGPTTVRLDGLELRGPDGRPILEVEHLTVSLATVPTEGEPLRIARLVLDHPTVHLRPDPDQLGFVPLGFSPFIEPDPLADPDSVAPQLRPSEVLELRHVEIVEGVVVVGDGTSTLLEVDGIGLVLDADPAATPAGTPGHLAHVVFGHPPGVVVEADAHIDLDRRVAWLERGHLAVELSDPALVAKLSPKVQALLRTHELAGHIEGDLTGRLDLTHPLRSTASLDLSLTGVHGAAGAWRLPIEQGRVEVELADGLAHITEASADLLGGRVALTQADLAMAESEVALAGDLELRGLALHQLLRRGGDDPTRQAVLDTTGRLFVASRDLSIGLVLDALTLGMPERTPVVSLERAEVRDLQVHGSGVPVTAEGVVLEGLAVELRLDGGEVQGLPLPPEAPVDAPPVDPPPGPHWSERFSIETVELRDSSVQIAPVGGAPWSLPGISGTLRSLGGPDPTSVEARLDAGTASVQGQGRLDLRAPALEFTRWTVAGDLAASATRSLLPPGLRDSVVALVPSGSVRGSGTARFPLGDGAPRVDLDLTLDDGAVALPGVRMPVSHGSAALSVAQGATRIANGALQGAGGTLSIPAAVLDASDKLTLSARAEGLRLDRIVTDAGAKVGLGRLSAVADVAVQFVSGPAGTAIGGLWMEDARVSIDGDPVGTLVWSDVDATLAPAGDVLRVSLGVHAGSGASAVATGSMAVGGDTVAIDVIDVSVELADPAGRAALPPSVQAGLADLRAGTLTVLGDGTLSLANPLRRSRAATTLGLEGGAWHYAGYRFGGLSGSAPLSLADATLRSQGGAVTGLGGRLGVEQAWWSIPDDRGRLDWTLSGLTLEQLRAMEGSPNTLAGAVTGSGKLDLRLDRPGVDPFARDLAQLEARLRDAGTLALHDKSSAQEVRATLGMSKKAFKRALGALYRRRLVVLDDRGVRWVGDGPAEG